MPPRLSLDVSLTPEPERFTSTRVVSGSHRGAGGVERAASRPVPGHEAAPDRGGKTGATPRPSGGSDGGAP